MANYDAEIRVNTRIDNTNFERGGKKIIHTLDQIEKGVDTAREKLKALEDMGVPKTHGLYQSAAKDLEKWTAELEAVKGKQAEAVSGISEPFNQMRADVEEYANSLKQLEKEGKYFGDADYDRLYKYWKDATDAVKEYQAQLNKQTEKGRAAEAERIAKAKEKQEAAERRLAAQAERNLQRESRQAQRENEKQAKIQAQAAEEQRLAQIKANATVSDKKVVELLERKRQLVKEIADLEKAGVTAGYKEYDSRQAELKGISKKLSERGDMKKTLSGISQISKRLNGILKAVGTTAAKAFDLISGGAKKAGRATDRAGFSFKRMLISSLAFSAMYRGFAMISEGIGKGFESLTAHSNEYASSVQQLKNALATLGNSFAAAFSPIIQAAIPYLVQLINWVNAAINAIGQLFAYLTGKSTFKKATEVQNGYNDALEGTAGAAKKAYGALAKFDDLDVLQKQETAGGGGAGGAVGGGFEEVPIDSEIKKFGDKIKDILSKFFRPLKEAWEREGKFVMEAWEYALDEVKKLVQDIGRDFLEVWNQEATIAMLANILHIIGDIGLVVGHLTRNFREAWNENETGLHILENIRDIFAVIIQNIREAADATVEWADKLNFGPLLEAFEKFTASLVPAFDALSGILTDFYTQVLLPLSKWVVEKGLPELLQVLTAFVEEVDWERLRQNFSDLWDSLEPFTETVGEGLILFIERVSELVAEFLNSQAFDDFLDHLAEWMDNVTPEDVAEGISNLAKAFIALKGVLIVLDGAIAASKLVTFIANLKNLVLVMKNMLDFIGGINFHQIFSFMNPGMMGELGMKIESFLEGTIFDPRSWEGLPGQVYDAIDKAVTAVIDFFGEMIVGAFESLGRIFIGTFNWDQTFAVLGEAGEYFEKAFNGEEIGKNIVLGLVNGIVGALGFIIEPIHDFVTTLVNTFCDLLGIHSPSTVFQEIGRYLIEGLLLGIQEMWLTLQEWFFTTFENLTLFFSEKWTAIKNGAVEIWILLKDSLSEIWTGIQEAVAEKFDAVQAKLEEVWEAIKNAIDLKVKSIKEKIDELLKKAKTFKEDASKAFTTVKENIINALSPVIDKIKEFINWVRDAIQAVQDFFSSGYDKVGSSAGKTSKGGGRSLLAADTAAAIDNLPHLASGSVIRGGSPFLAVLGDQRPGQTNVEAPLSTIRQAVREELSSLHYGGGQLKVTLNVNGSDLAQAVLQDFLSEMNRQGYDVEVLGVT